MTVRPLVPPHPLTVAEYLALGEVEPGCTELVEGRLVMCASPVYDHQELPDLEGGVLRASEALLVAEEISAWAWEHGQVG